MQNDIIVLKDEDCMNHHIFCSSCHYWFVMSEVGSNYCPHCGQKLFWNDYPKAKKTHKIFYELGLKRYQELIINEYAKTGLINAISKETVEKALEKTEVTYNAE